MQTYLSLLIEGLVFLVILISAVGGVWAKLTRDQTEQDKRLVKAETELEALKEQKRQDQETRKTIYSRFDKLETEISVIDKKVTQIDAKLSDGYPDGR